MVRSRVNTLEQTIRCCVCVLFVLFSLICFSDTFFATNNQKTDVKYVEITENTSDGLTIRIGKYVDSDGEVVIPPGVSFAQVIMYINEQGLIQKELFLNVEGDPLRQPQGHFGDLRCYDGNQNCINFIYTDDNFNPITNVSGYSSVHREYDNNCYIIKESYFGVDGKPVVANGGQHCQKYTYNPSNRRESIVSFWDVNEERVTIDKGYSLIERVCDESGSIYSEMYFNSHGAPVSLERGQYGIKRINGQNILLNKNGKILFCLDNLFTFIPWITVLIGVLLVISLVVMPQSIRKYFVIFYLSFVLYQTFALRDYIGGVRIELLWSYKQFFYNQFLRKEIINNIWLFIPLGAGVYLIFKKYKMLFAPVIISILIELCQFVTKLGLCEIDDIISNSLGVIAGAFFAKTMTSCYLKIKTQMDNDDC